VACKQFPVLALDGRVGRQHTLTRETGGKLHAPRARGARDDVHLQLVHEAARATPQQRQQFAAVPLRAAPSPARRGQGCDPFLRRPSSHHLDVAARLARQSAAALQPVAHTARACVIGSGRQTEVAKLRAQFAQELGSLGQGLHGIEWIEQLPLVGGSGHELRDPKRAGPAARRRTHGVGAEVALAPEHAHEVFERQLVGARRRFDHQAHRVRGRAGGRRRRRPVRARLRDRRRRILRSRALRSILGSRGRQRQQQHRCDRDCS